MDRCKKYARGGKKDGLPWVVSAPRLDGLRFQVERIRAAWVDGWMDGFLFVLWTRYAHGNGNGVIYVLAVAVWVSTLFVFSSKNYCFRSCYVISGIRYLRTRASGLDRAGWDRKGGREEG